MNKIEKINFLEQKLNEIIKIKESQDDISIKEFETLKNEISAYLVKAHKLRFDSLEFFEIINESPTTIDEDDLPF